MKLIFHFKNPLSADSNCVELLNIFFSHYHIAYVKAISFIQDKKIIESLPFDNIHWQHAFTSVSFEDFTCLEREDYWLYYRGFQFQQIPYIEKLYPHYSKLFIKAVTEKFKTVLTYENSSKLLVEAV